MKEEELSKAYVQDYIKWLKTYINTYCKKPHIKLLKLLAATMYEIDGSLNSALFKIIHIDPESISEVDAIYRFLNSNIGGKD